jgi:hypothetical protein
MALIEVPWCIICWMTLMKRMKKMKREKLKVGLGKRKNT